MKLLTEIRQTSRVRLIVLASAAGLMLGLPAFSPPTQTVTAQEANAQEAGPPDGRIGLLRDRDGFRGDRDGLLRDREGRLEHGARRDEDRLREGILRRDGKPRRERRMTRQIDLPRDGFGPFGRFRPQTDREEALFQVIRELRQEVDELRMEVRQTRRPGWRDDQRRFAEARRFDRRDDYDRPSPRLGDGRLLDRLGAGDGMLLEHLVRLIDAERQRMEYEQAARAMRGEVWDGYGPGYEARPGRPDLRDRREIERTRDRVRETAPEPETATETEETEDDRAEAEETAEAGNDST